MENTVKMYITEVPKILAGTLIKDIIYVLQ